VGRSGRNKRPNRRGSLTDDERAWRSASQIDAYSQCPRKWAWRRLDGIKTEPKPSLALGIAVHEQLEHYLAEGKELDLTTDAGRIALAGLHYLPKPGTPGLEVNNGSA
jgi:CRISPR/Cas system-associated exonuclease Cas4 (RecB family)